jgi:hypothetical protein
MIRFGLVLLVSILGAGCDPCLKQTGTQYFIGPSGDLAVGSASGAAIAGASLSIASPIVPLDDNGHVEDGGSLALALSDAQGYEYAYAFDVTSLTNALVALGTDLRGDDALAPLVGSTFTSSLEEGWGVPGTGSATVIADGDGHVALAIELAVAATMDAGSPPTDMSFSGVQRIGPDSSPIEENLCD